MQKFRTFGFILVAIFTVVFSVSARNVNSPKVSVKQQQLIEGVDIQGNRRLRDDDLLYYIKTRPGDVYSQAQLERDLKELLSLNFFDKTETKVLTEEGPRVA